MIVARYWNPHLDRPIEKEVHSTADAAALLDEVRILSSERGHPALEISRNDGSSISIASDDETAFLVLQP